MLRIALASTLLLATSAAAAQEAPPRELTASVTFSPVHLALPFGEISAEFHVAPKLGLGVIAGAGSVTTNDISVSLYEIGASPRYYVVGDFRQGVQLGFEVAYIHGSTDDQVMSTVTAVGLSVGPYVGYKWAARIGLTLEAQLGASYLAIRGESTSSTSEESRIGPLLNLQVGWSF